MDYVSIKRITCAALCALSFGMPTLSGAEEDPTASELGIMKGFVKPEGMQVNAANWNVYPLNRWSFQNVRRILPTAPLKTDPERTVPFVENRQNLTDISVELPDGTTKTSTEIFESWQTDSIVVLHNGELIYERYWNGMTPQSPHYLASVSKSFIGTVAAMLVDRGVLDRDATVETYVPELAGSGFADATVGQILDMTAGTDWDESPAAFADASSPARQYFAAAGALVMPGEESLGVANFLPSVSQARPHGDVFVYNSPQTDVAGWIVANASGRSVLDNVQEMIWSKLGPECEAYYLLDGAGNPFATGGMNICARDMARFGQMMLNEGHFGGQRIVPDNVVKQITKLGSREAFAAGPRASTYPDGAYRDFWWITNDEDGAYLAKGVFGQLIYINPSRQVVIARHASEEEASNSQRTIEVETTFAAISRFLDK
ncbi:serine hydrolase [Labrenzia sp. DG1229]|uniref:serine hydrolase domain-containing protein n=1 Tax=Labrenzia sp. DG1229 TaxID=681847 RepID=UPI00068957D8|nr:serine hydrolase [Labrenzia sp. DG1229]